MPNSAASSHASLAFLSSNGAQQRLASFALPQLADRQPPNGGMLGSNHGQQKSQAVSPAQNPTAARTAQPTSVVPYTTNARPSHPAADASSSTLALQTVHPATKIRTGTPSSTDVLKSSLITSAPAVNGKSGNYSSRQHGPTGDAHGPTATDSPVGQRPAVDPPVSKPVLKMKRTGQNFPISSPRSRYSPLRTSASWNQRRAPSPNKNMASVPQGSGSSLSKTPSTPQSHGPKLPTAVNGPKLAEEIGSGPSGQPSANSRNGLTCESFFREPALNLGSHLNGLSKPPPAPSKTGFTPGENVSITHHTESAPHSGKDLDGLSDDGDDDDDDDDDDEDDDDDDDSSDEDEDDEIKYEPAPKAVFSDDALEASVEEDTSDDDTESSGDVDDEEAPGSLLSPGGDASSGQLFHPPEESDYGDETDDDNRMGSPSSSSPVEMTLQGRLASTAVQTGAKIESEDPGDGDLATEDTDAPGRPAVPLTVIRPGNADEMWKYIRPFLIKQNSIPTLNWVRHVIHLPRVRDLKWNEPRIKDVPYRDSHPRDVTALIVQITGIEAPTLCTNCAQGKGPFDGCIMISPQASQESRSHVLACANCYYHCRQSTCSHCSSVVPRRRDRHERLTQKKKIYNLKVLSDKARGAVEAPKIVQQRRQSKVDHSLEDASQGNMRVYRPSEIRSLEMASETRAYKVIHDKNGEAVSMCGALIPEGYDQDRAIPGRPWVCPVRSCRAVFKKIVGLGSHFSIKHRGCLLNDNQSDGTLSIVGVYNRPLPGLNYCPPLVISQNPLDKNEPPMVAPKAPGYTRVDNANAKPSPQLTENTALGTLRSTRATQMNGGERTNSSIHDGAKRIWNYILPFLPQSLEPGIFNSNSEVVRLFALPSPHSVQWRKEWRKRRLDNDQAQIFAILMHMLGVDRQAAGSRPCSLCSRGEGPFEGCWTLPRAAAWESHKYGSCCANCLFIHRKSECSVRYAWEKRCDTKPGEKTFLGAPPPVSEWAASAAIANSGVAQGKKREVPPAELNEEPPPQRRRYERNQDAETEQAAVGKEPLTLPLHTSKRATRSSGSPSKRNKSPQPQAPHSNSLSTRSSPVLIMPGRQTSDDLEMEDWEVAPGRIQEENVDRFHNIAFSKAYLENNQGIPVAADVSFRVHTIKSGHRFEFEADNSKARYCSIASGKLRVSITGQPDFVIGPHGVFKIKPGVKAWAQNRLYVDSVVHIISVEDSG